MASAGKGFSRLLQQQTDVSTGSASQGTSSKWQKCKDFSGMGRSTMQELSTTHCSSKITYIVVYVPELVF